MPRFLPLPLVAPTPYTTPAPEPAEATIRRCTVALLLGFSHVSQAAGGAAARRPDGTTLVLAHTQFAGPDFAPVWGQPDPARLPALRRPGALAALAVWQGLALQWLALGPARPLAERLAARRPGWSGAGFAPADLVREMGFRLVCPPDRTQGDVARDVSIYKPGLVNQPTDVLTLEQAQALRGA